MFETAARAILVGIGATALIDAWALMLKHLFGASSLDFRLVGRWVGHMRQGRFVHERIGAAPAVRGELALGWLIHYATGVFFAGLLVVIAGPDWLKQPTLAPALVFGLLSVAAPFLLLQPALGLGVAASKTARPTAARLRSLATHLVFGLGLFVFTAVTAALVN